MMEKVTLLKVKLTSHPKMDLQNRSSIRSPILNGSNICSYTSEAWSQFWTHMRDCTISEGSEVRNRSSIHSPVLNANLEASEETGATNTSRANRDNIIYLLVLDFYQSSKLKFFSFTPSQSSIKYLSTSFLHPTDFVTCLKAL